MPKKINAWVWDRPSRMADVLLQQLEFLNSFTLPTGSGCSGSRQPTKSDFIYILNNSNILGISLGRKKIEKIVFFDLRQELHLHTDVGPVGAAAITIADENSDSEEQYQVSELFFQDEDALKRIILTWPWRVFTEIKIKKNKDPTLLHNSVIFEPGIFEFAMVQTELEIIQQLNNDPNKDYVQLEYRRLSIKDHGIPGTAEVEDFVQFAIDAAKSNTWVHFHCHGGKGRTSTFIAMYNLIYSRLNPDCGLNDFMILSHPKLSAENNKVDVGSGQGERVKFINSFRNYIEAITSDLLAGNPIKLWSVWLEMDIRRFYPSP